MKARISTQSIEIKNSLVPCYYDQFSCIAADCQDSCCHDWAIPFNKEDYTRLKSMDVPEDYKQLLDASIQPLDEEVKAVADPSLKLYGQLVLDENGHCPLLTEEGLCSLQLRCGPEALPTVCRTFPRETARTPQGKERKLSTACEAVLQLLWELPQGVDFILSDLPPEEQEHFQIPEFRYLPWFVQIRSLCIDIMQERSLSLAHRMIYMGIVLRELQDMPLDDASIAAWESKHLSLLGTPELQQALQDVKGNQTLFLEENLALLNSTKSPWSYMILLELRWLEAQLQQVPEETITDIAHLPQLYQQGLDSMESTLGNLDYFLENIMVSLVFDSSIGISLSFDALWKNYVYLCKLYSHFRFVMGCCCAFEASKKRLFHYLVQCSRSFTHSPQRADDLKAAEHLRDFNVKKYTTNDFGNLAILVCG